MRQTFFSPCNYSYGQGLQFQIKSTYDDYGI